MLLIPITSERWKSPDMSLAVEQARDSARRIQKKVDIRDYENIFSHVSSFFEINNVFGENIVERSGPVEKAK
ncbi:MAG: hypothetical protein AAB267_01835, partial [Candidatus Desantisbacteria bacterium]